MRTVPERVYSTAACASSARISLQLSVLSLDVSILQQLVLPLDVSVLQQVVLPQDMFVPHLTVQSLKSKQFLSYGNPVLPLEVFWLAGFFDCLTFPSPPSLHC
jgi:hypothetical protein